MNRILVFILILFGFSFPSVACTCSFLGDFKVEEVEKYDYVGLVKIKTLQAGDLPVSRENNSKFYHWAEVEEIIGYKGILPDRVKIYGGNRKFKYQTSCDLGVNEGEEWVVFAEKMGEDLWLRPCKRNTRYKNSEGLRDWQYLDGFKELSVLDSAFKEGKYDFLESGKDTLFYSNGQIERVQSFKNGELQGNRIYYYPNGKIYGTEVFRKGQLHGPSQWNYSDGSRLVLTNYKSGKKVGYSYYWSALDNENPELESFYDKKGRILVFKDFDEGKNGRYIISESKYDYRSGTYTIFYYSEESKIIEKGVYSISDSSQIDLVQYDEDH